MPGHKDESAPKRTRHDYTSHGYRAVTAPQHHDDVIVDFVWF